MTEYSLIEIYRSYFLIKFYTDTIYTWVYMSQTNEQCISIYSFENFRIEVTEHFDNCWKKPISLCKRGFGKDYALEVFETIEKLNRTNLYSKKTDDPTRKICLPLVTDTNPALPNMSDIIKHYKYMLDLGVIHKGRPHQRGRGSAKCGRYC